MATNVVCLNVDGDRLVQSLEDAAQKLDSAGGELVLDFSSVRRIDSSGLRAMEDLAGAAAGKNVKLALRAVNVDVYKVFKLLKAESQFAFAV